MGWNSTPGMRETSAFFSSGSAARLKLSSSSIQEPIDTSREQSESWSRGLLPETFGKMRAQTIADECTNHPDSPRRGIMENSSTALLRVLIVDDDDAFRAALIEFLQMRSRHVRSCKDGQEAIRVLREENEP